jgi:hypothetical protein
VTMLGLSQAEPAKVADVQADHSISPRCDAVHNKKIGIVMHALGFADRAFVGGAEYRLQPASWGHPW